MRRLGGFGYFLEQATRQSMVIPGSGHYCLEEAPEETLAALTAFLAPHRDSS